MTNWAISLARSPILSKSLVILVVKINKRISTATATGC
jgi:hypothetical protein